MNGTKNFFFKKRVRNLHFRKVNKMNEVGGKKKTFASSSDTDKSRRFECSLDFCYWWQLGKWRIGQPC